MEASRKFSCLFLFSLFSLNHFIIFKISATLQSFSLDITCIVTLHLYKSIITSIERGFIFIVQGERSVSLCWSVEAWQDAWMWCI